MHLFYYKIEKLRKTVRFKVCLVHASPVCLVTTQFQVTHAKNLKYICHYQSQKSMNRTSRFNSNQPFALRVNGWFKLNLASSLFPSSWVLFQVMYFLGQFMNHLCSCEVIHICSDYPKSRKLANAKLLVKQNTGHFLIKNIKIATSCVML